MTLINYFKALSDKTRLRILNLLLQNELSVNEITSVLKMGQSRISRHLKIMTDCGLLISRRDGLWVFYKSADRGRSYEFIKMLSNFFGQDFDMKIDLSRLGWILKEKEKEKAEYFDSIASDWDNIKKNILGDFNITEEIIPRVNKCEIAADLGCGTGELLLSLTEKSEKVIGIDKSPKMLEEVKSRFMEDSSNVDLRVGEIEQLPVRDRETDFAVINMVLHHLSSPFNGIAEANRILKNESLFVIVDLDKHKNEDMRDRFGHRWLGFSKDEMAAWLNKAGFTIKNTLQFKVKHKMKINMYFSIKNQNISNLNQINIKEIYYEH